MPELPDVEVYREAIEARVRGAPLQKVRLASPFLLRTVEPPLGAAEGREVRAVRRLGKRLVLALEGDLFLALHLMIAGRLHWKEAGAKLGGKAALAAFDFPHGALTLTEAGSKRRAALHLVRGEAALRALDRGGVEPLEVDLAGFAAALRRERHTLKRALTDPGILAGIGNAYSDEILHRARLSPTQLAQNLSEEELARLHAATRAVLTGWTERLRREAGGDFPEGVTAFREGMAVHGRHRQPCPDCGAPVQRIVRAENEVNYCPRCQTGGRILSDRSLARLLAEDWPKTLEELEKNPGLGLRPPAAPARRGAVTARSSTRAR
ncbi:Fpg/Nei family DNA glycosylase [Anaeromyxobacter paludicola]|uniref:Formamidopyrimidine-DNA glycosylase n=1 Tax=Anaeromyxobacter paludicola TaxID=2918171 RepID=A0ABM7XF45_9BACT|nr:DNA-formamidopyrimidine glycosylase family protein [Anaeromyxobacter paludicola]BDG10510.1 formamidopyrimidine-DNA glycosylase [Anaeromyxobacter paludicola]